MGEREVANVLEVLEQLRDGWERLDPETVLRCFDVSEDVVVIGTDESEYWVGYSQFEGPFRQMGESFSDATYVWEEVPQVVIKDDCAWASGVLKGNFMHRTGPVSLVMRTTHVLAHGKSGWRIVQAHYSVPASDPVSY